MSNVKRTDRKLQDASNHLHYEFSMLMFVAQAFDTGIAAQGWLVNALLESFVIHIRVLLGFFFPPDNVKEDDVLAQDYFDDDGWKKIQPQLSEVLSSAKFRANKEVAHLTYTRLNVTPETKGWEFSEIANEMSKVIDIFIKNVPRNRLGSRWSEQ